MQDRCEICHWWVFEWEYAGIIYGRCHKKAPSSEKGSPIVDRNNFCGDFELDAKKRDLLIEKECTENMNKLIMKQDE